MMSLQIESSKRGMMKIKLISWNIWHGKYLDEVVEFLIQEDADVLCLQEMGTTGQGLAEDPKIDIHEEIVERVGVQGKYQRMFWGDNGWGKYDMGVSILTRLPVVDWKKFYYEGQQADSVLDIVGKDRYDIPRVLMGAKLLINGLDKWFFTTHFTLSPEAKVTEHQLANAKKVRSFLKDCGEFVLCGDMNTPYGTETYRVLSEGLVDVTEPKQATLHPTMHKVGHLGYHVDYVFFKGSSIKHLSTKIPLVDASDHLPIVCEFEIGSEE
jgi:endonuclease/exonuclease/phosphatase family metal-dependent hydrolase